MASMLRAALTLALVIAALILAAMPRGAALLGFARPLLIAALVLMGVLQVHRLGRLWQSRHQKDALEKIPKRPLGL